jgi:trk system potassium uptake protein TrkH
LRTPRRHQARRVPRFTRLTERPIFTRPETAVGHVVGLTLAIAGTGMLVAGIVEKLDGGPDASALIVPAAAIGVPGLLLWRRTVAPARLSTPTIYGTVLSAWIAFALAAAVPYALSRSLPRFDLALFEAVSGFTTTSSTVLVPFDGVSRGIFLWRATTQWLGGIGVIVFVISVLPFISAAGSEQLGGLARAQDRLAPRVRETAKRLVLLYVGFTLVVSGLYFAFGMTSFDAVAHAFTTVSTGGFSTHERSIAFFASPALEWCVIGVMVLAGGSFALYWRALRGKPFAIIRSIEFRVYLGLLALVAGAAVIWNANESGWSADAIRQTIFGVVSIGTTTGYNIVDYNLWPGAVQLLLVFLMAIGAMTGSTAGGLKVFRLMGIVGHVRRHLFRQLHPRAVPVVRLGKEVVSEADLSRILGFFGLFMGIGAAATFLVAAIGSLDLRTSISVVATSIGNVGPALGAVGSAGHYLDVHAGVRAVMMVVMLAGRLEVYPVLLGLVPLVRFVGDRLPRPLAKAFVRLGRG